MKCKDIELLFLKKKLYTIIDKWIAEKWYTVIDKWITEFV